MSTLASRIRTRMERGVMSKEDRELLGDVLAYMEGNAWEQNLPPSDKFAHVLEDEGVTLPWLRAASRRHSHTNIRARVAYRLRAETDLTWPEIVRVLGRSHHTTAMYLARRHATTNGLEMP